MWVSNVLRHSANIPNVLDGVADNLLVVKLCLGRDLTKDHDHAGLDGRLAGHLGVRILAKAGIEDGVRHLVAAKRLEPKRVLMRRTYAILLADVSTESIEAGIYALGVAASDRLAGEQKSVWVEVERRGAVAVG
jgi:hypothetical protein